MKPITLILKSLITNVLLKVKQLKLLVLQEWNT